jgi:hypothetical protein
LGGPSVLSCVDLGGDVGARDRGEEDEEEKAGVEMLQRFREHGYGCREDWSGVGGVGGLGGPGGLGVVLDW